MGFRTGYKKNIMHFKNGFPFNPVCYFYKRKVQETVGPFSLDEHYAMDYWFILEAFRKFSFTRIPRVFGVFFKHGENKTSNSDNFENCTKVAVTYRKKYDRRLLYFYRWNLLLHVAVQ